MVRRTIEPLDSRTHVSYLTPSHYLARGANIALAAVRTPYVALVNDDVRLTPNWVESALDGLERHRDYASLASRVLSARIPGLLDSCGDTLYRSGLATNNGWRQPATGWREPREVFSAAGCLATYRTTEIRRVGLLDETFGAYLEDIDLGFRLQLVGGRCLYWPAAEASHIGGATRKGPQRAARLVERNTVLNLVKNLPDALVHAHLREILCAQLWPCAFEGQRSARAWAHGKLTATRHLKAALVKRRHIQASRVVSDGYIASILGHGQPAVCHL